MNKFQARLCAYVGNRVGSANGWRYLPRRPLGPSLPWAVAQQAVNQNNEWGNTGLIFNPLAIPAHARMVREWLHNNHIGVREWRSTTHAYCQLQHFNGAFSATCCARGYHQRMLALLMAIRTLPAEEKG